ncbi:hypothetical protein EON64_02485 [archaeon]|nr:MAG: hypothetical protein EON64_02485 [archaeon]
MRSVQNNSATTDALKTSTVPPSSSRSKMLPSSRPKGTPDLSQSFTLSRASSMEFRSSVDHRKDLEELYEGDFGSQDVANQQTVVKAYVPPEEPSSQFSRLIPPSSSQSSLHSAEIARIYRVHDEPMDTFDLIVSSSQNSSNQNSNSQNSYSQSSNSQESAASRHGRGRRKRSRSVLEGEESSLFPMLQDSNMVSAAVPIDSSTGSNFYAYSPMLEDPVTSNRPHPSGSATAALPPASYCSPNESNQKKSLFSTIMGLATTVGSFFGGKAVEDPGSGNTLPFPKPVANAAALVGEQEQEGEDDDANTVSTLNDNLDFTEEEHAYPHDISQQRCSSGASVGVPAGIVGPDEALITPSKRTMRSTSQSPDRTASEDEDMTARRELYATRLPELCKLLNGSSEISSSVRSMVESCLVMRKVSPFICAQRLAKALRANQEASSAVKKSVGKGKANADSLPLKVLGCMLQWAKEKCRNNLVFVEDACFVCALLASLIIEFMGFMQTGTTSNAQMATLQKKLAVVFDRYLLVSSVPCVKNRITIYNLLAKEQPQLKKDLDYMHKKYSYLLSAFVVEIEEHMSPNTILLRRNNVSLNVHFHIFIAVLKVVYAQSEVYDEHVQSVVTGYDFGARALQDSPQLSEEGDEAISNAQPLLPSSKSQMEKLDQMLGKRLRTSDELRPVANLTSVMAENKPLPFSGGENLVNGQPALIPPPPASVSLKRTNSLISKRQVLTHRGSMRPTITQSIPLPPPVQHHVLMSPTPAKKRRSSSPMIVMNTPGATTVSSSNNIIVSTPFNGSTAISTPQRHRQQVTTPSKSSPKKSTRLF